MANKWERRFDNHALWNVVDSVKTDLVDLEMPSDAALADDVQRIQRLVSVLDTYREADNKELYTESMLQSAHSAFSQYVQTPFNQYRADPTTYSSNLTNAADACDSVYDALAKWPPLTTKGHAIAAGQAAVQYAEASRTSLAKFEELTTKLSTQLGQLDEQLRSRLDTLDTNVDTKYEEISADAQQRIASLATELSTLSAAVETHKTNLQTLESATDTNLNAKLESFDTWSRELADEKVKAAIRELGDETQQARDAIDGFRSETKGLTESIRELADETSNLAQSFAQSAVARSYHRNAINKAWSGWIWDVLGLALAAIPLYLILFHFVGTPDNGGPVTALTLNRIGISIAAVGVAALCFHRGSINHRESRISKRAALRVGSVHQFVANLDPSVGRAVLEGMADQIYLQGHLETQPDPDDGTNVATALLEKYRRSDSDDKKENQG